MSSEIERTTIDMTKEPHELPDYVQTMEVTDASGKRRQLIFPKGLDLDRPKRCRTSFSGDQLRLLEQAFQANQYLVGSERRRLADTLRLSETQIKVWYQNRRTKCKKQKDKTPHTPEMLPTIQTPWWTPAQTMPVLPLVSVPSTTYASIHHEMAAKAAVATPRPQYPEDWHGRVGFPQYCPRPCLPFDVRQINTVPYFPHAPYRWSMKPC